MTPEEKQLLLKDLCARLPYETWVQYDGKEWLVTGYGHGRVSLLPSVFSSVGGPCPLVEEIKPYLRPMSSMYEMERGFFRLVSSHRTVPDGFGGDVEMYSLKCIDWLDANHFDYRGLIENGLALKATEEMYKTK